MSPLNKSVGKRVANSMIDYLEILGAASAVFSNKKASQLTLEGFVEGKGFEPSVSLRPTHAFQACSLNHSDTPLNGVQN